MPVNTYYYKDTKHTHAYEYGKCTILQIPLMPNKPLVKTFVSVSLLYGVCLSVCVSILDQTKKKQKSPKKSHQTNINSYNG